MALFDGAVLEDARTIMARYPEGRERSAVMPLLYLAQSVEGYVSLDGMRAIGELLGITTAEVEAVATFYTMYRMHPTGEHVVNVCTNLACMLRGAREVHAEALDAAGLQPGQEVSDDGLFTVHEEECLGVCDFAPAVQVNVANHDTVTPERIRTIVADLRDGRTPEPSRGPAFRSYKEACRVLAGLDQPATHVAVASDPAPAAPAFAPDLSQGSSVGEATP
ncbi:MAG TPA: NAD(P)H-dependent oxidoreductase subunit E [Actinomycetota bacterium]|nr:NAD(P)H-dependent oxidoreductase subunit E [Actinomycetota bacterium]